MKKLTLLISILLIVQLANAQITFQKTFGGAFDDRAYGVQQTIDGGYIIIGSAQSFGAGGLSDVYLIKTDANADTLWTKTYGGATTEAGYAVQQTLDSGYIITGSAPGVSTGDVYLIKTDINGNLLWKRRFHGVDNDRGLSVQQTSDGGYIVTGWTGGFATNNYVYLIKTNSIGNLLWSKTFGGTQNDYGNCVQQTTDGGYIICGYTLSFGVGSEDVYLIKTDSIGNLLWSKTFGGVSTDKGTSVQQTTDGGYIITGNTSSFGTGFDDVYLIKTDANGNLLWSKTFGENNFDYGNSVRQTTDGGYIVTGYTSSFGAGNGSEDIYLIKTDTNGDTLWSKIFGGSYNEYGNSVKQTSDTGYIITGYTGSFGAGYYDLYLIKTDVFGNSGCNEINVASIVTAPLTQVTSPTTIVTSLVASTGVPSATVYHGGIVNTLCTSVGINETAIDNSFLIYPNPTAGNFIISFEGTIMKGKIIILNTLGENVFTEDILNESRKEINLKNISHGIYFVKVFDGEKYYCKKIIIEKD